MDKLKILDIDKTNIDDGLEYLPDSITSFRCSVVFNHPWEEKKRVSNIEQILKSYGKREDNYYEFVDMLKLWKKDNHALVIAAFKKELKKSDQRVAELKQKNIKLKEELQIEREEFKKFQDKSVEYQKKREDKIKALEEQVVQLKFQNQESQAQIEIEPKQKNK